MEEEWYMSVDNIAKILSEKLGKDEYETVMEKLYLALNNINIPIFLTTFLDYLVKLIEKKKIEVQSRDWINFHNLLQKVYRIEDTREKRKILSNIFISFSKFRHLE